jgi:hypothetical protein
MRQLEAFKPDKSTWNIRLANLQFGKSVALVPLVKSGQ